MLPTSSYSPYTFALYNLVLPTTTSPPALLYSLLFPLLSHAHKYCIAYHVELPNKPFSMCSSFFHMRSSSCSSWFRCRLAASRGRHFIRSEDGWLDDCLDEYHPHPHRSSQALTAGMRRANRSSTPKCTFHGRKMRPLFLSPLLL